MISLKQKTFDAIIIDFLLSFLQTFLAWNVFNLENGPSILALLANKQKSHKIDIEMNDF